MKYTVENTAAIGQYKEVWLDGKFIENAFEADTEEGYVLTLKEDENGEIEISPKHEFVTQRLTGVVVVKDRVA